MARDSVDITTAHFEDFEPSGSTENSGPDTLNKGFYRAYTSNKSRNSHPAVARASERAVEGPVTISLTLKGGDDVLTTIDHDLEPGDIITLRHENTGIRIKFYGTVYSRHEDDHIVNELAVVYSLDRWEAATKTWTEIQRHSGTNQGSVEEQVGDYTLRVYLADAPGLDPEADIKDLISGGLSPAEALDYWMVELRKHTQSDWAEVRGRSQQAISKNIRAAESKLED